MGIKKNLKKLLAEPTEMRIAEIQNILEYFGYNHTRTKGSHYIFTKANCDNITIAVHKNKIARIYIKIIKEQIKNIISR